MKYIIHTILVLSIVCQCRHKEEQITTQFSGKPQVPLSIQKEHKDLLDKIHTISLFKDSSGRTALKLADLMKHHFAEEEDYVLPQLGLLPLLASGQIPVEKDNVTGLSEKLNSRLTHLSAEHQLITAFAIELRAAGNSHPEIVQFESELQKHASVEEEVLFPAAILIGEFLKLKSN